ncbi:MAG: ribonuclease HII [Microgenomates group bacterium]|nr:ribonuclease HII [Microgenomates group bacterium]
MAKKLPDFKEEKKLWQKKFFAIGIDEVGRGALAGPLTVAGVIFPMIRNKDKQKFLEGLEVDDSKRLSLPKRQMLYQLIKKEAIIAKSLNIEPKKIDKLGLQKAEALAIRKLIFLIKQRLKNKKIFLLIDGFWFKYIKGVGLKNQKAIIKGDQKSISIAAASIIAKVERDRLMIKLSRQFPHYFWEKNKGYGTLKHRLAIKKHGPTPFHRQLFLRKMNSN